MWRTVTVRENISVEVVLRYLRRRGELPPVERRGQAAAVVGAAESGVLAHDEVALVVGHARLAGESRLDIGMGAVLECDEQRPERAAVQAQAMMERRTSFSRGPCGRPRPPAPRPPPERAPGRCPRPGSGRSRPPAWGRR